MANSADPDQLASSDLDLHCLERQGISRFSRTRVEYWDKQACANSVDPDKGLIRVYTICHSSSNILDTSTGSRMASFKFCDKYGLTHCSLETPEIPKIEIVLFQYVVSESLFINP